MKKAVLITSAGRRVGLINAARSSLSQLGLNWKIIAVDLAPDLSAACQSADVAYSVPSATSGGYIDALLRICREEQVGLVIPTIDTELLQLSVHELSFAEENIRVNIGEPEFVRLAGDKNLTATRLAEIGIETPRTWRRNDPVEDVRFPVISKPNSGSSSIGIMRYASAEELDRKPPDADSIIQELLEGPEYTVNVYCDDEGAFRCAVPHRRIEIRAGEVSKGRTERRADLIEIAEKIATLSGVRGAFCFQAILTDTGPVVFEINARFGGGYPLAHQAGATFTKWLLEEAAGLPRTSHNSWKDGLLMLRFDSEVFVP